MKKAYAAILFLAGCQPPVLPNPDLEPIKIVPITGEDITETQPTDLEPIPSLADVRITNQSLIFALSWYKDPPCTTSAGLNYITPVRNNIYFEQGVDVQYYIALYRPINMANPNQLYSMPEGVMMYEYRDKTGEYCVWGSTLDPNVVGYYRNYF